MRKLYLSFLLFFFSLIPLVYAEADVDLLDIPEYLGEALGVGTFAGGILATAVLTMFMVLPIALISRKKNMGIIPELIMGMLALSASVAMAWLPIWIFTVLCLLIAIMYATKFKDMI